MNAANTILAVFALLVSLWAWVSARNARDGIAKVLRLLNARVRPMVEEAEGHKKPPTWRDVPPLPRNRGYPTPPPGTLPPPPPPRRPR